ncbi:MAG: hypothetical protein KAJ49_07805, partial [Arcobacteraceae bacterium]|nr:hypothetical protein [Arcobacteraceae bacterium]
MVQSDNKVYFTSSSATNEDIKNDEITKYFTYYKEVSSVVKKAFDTKTIQYGEATDRWGTFRSVLIPIQSKGGQCYIVGADIEIGFIADKLHEFLIQSIIDLFILMIVILPFIYKFRKNLKDEISEQLSGQKAMQEQGKLA